MRWLRGNAVAKNVTALTAVQLAGFVLPLLTVPYLARVLRPDGWGLVVFAQSYAAWLTLVLEYGFNLSATRSIALSRDDPEQIAAIVTGVNGGKCLLALLAFAISLVVVAIVPAFRAHPVYLFWASVSAIVYGSSPLWYFQGVERMTGASLAEVAARVVAAIGVFVLVRGPEQGWVVLALQAATGTLFVAITTCWLYQEVPFIGFRPHTALSALREGWRLFVFRSASGLYTLANSFLLGLFAGPQSVAFYGGAEKLVRAGVSLLNPVSQALYPRVVHLVGHERDEAVGVVRVSLILLGGIGVLAGAGTALFAPVLVRVLLGPAYASAVPVLRVLALLLPLIAVGTVLGVQWALPWGLDRPFYRLVIAAGVINVLLAAVLARPFGALGMAWSAVLSEAVVVIGLVWVLVRSGGEIWNGIWRRGTPRSASGAEVSVTD